MIEFRLDTRSGVPAYLQIVQQVKRAVQMGLLQPGDQLPTLREAVGQIAVNPNTVLKAYRELERDRMVEGRRGQGTFLSLDVASTPPATHTALQMALIRWVRRARAAGLDDDGIEGLLSTALLQHAGDDVVNVISTRQLGMQYGKRTALTDCTLEIPAGSVTALIGPNGAGKTTLLHLVAGLLEPTAGTIEVFGANPRTQPLEVLPRLGFVGQDHSLERNFSVKEMLAFGRRLNPSWHDDVAHEALRAHAIPLDAKIGRLSGGQRSQVALALARAKKPDLLVLDEPVAALDPFARREFNASLMQAVASDCTVLLSSHLVTDLERVCDHLVLLRDGRVRLVGSIDDVMATHHLLVGPADAVATMPPEVEIIDQSRTDRQATVLVRSLVPAFDSRWDIRGLSFEDLVLGYLGGAMSPEVAA